MATRPPDFEFDGEGVECPECGGNAKRYFRGNAGYRVYWHWVECQECGAEMSLAAPLENWHPMTPTGSYAHLHRIINGLRYVAGEKIISWAMKIALSDMIRPELMGTRHSAPDSNG